MRRPRRKTEGASIGVRGGNLLTPREAAQVTKALKKNPGTPIEDPKFKKDLPEKNE